MLVVWLLLFDGRCLVVVVCSLVFVVLVGGGYWLCVVCVLLCL